MDAQDHHRHRPQEDGRRRQHQQHPENGDAPRGRAAAESRLDVSELPSAGGFGRFQKELLVLTWVPALLVGFSQFSDYFLLAQPTNTCVWWGNVTLPDGTAAGIINGTAIDGSATDGRTAGGARDNGSARCVCAGGPYELEQGLAQNVVTTWDLVCSAAWIVHITKFSLLVGSIFGYLVMGVLADWFGRRVVLLTSVFFMLAFGLAVAFSVKELMFILLRFFEGFCLAGITLSLYVLRIELCIPTYRFPVTMVASFVGLGGQLLLPGLAALCGDWKVLQAVIVCPFVFMLSYFWLFPESLRWLLATQQYREAKGLLVRVAKKNNVNTEEDGPDILAEVQSQHQRKPKKTCIVKMVGTRNLWKNIVVLCVNSLTGYGIHHCFARSLRDPEANETTLFHSFYADYYTMAVLGKYSVHLNIEQSDTLNRNFSIAFSIIGMFSSHAVSNLSIFFCAEITPTAIRGGGLGLVLASAGFGLLTAPIMELLNQKGYFLHHIIFACCTLICIICILLLPEPRGQPLPEAIADGENYTRKPFLPPRRPGEPRRFLSRSGSRDYSRVRDTPLHQIPAATGPAVPLTIDPTAFSATDPNGHPTIDLTIDIEDPAVTLTTAPDETLDTQVTIPLIKEATFPSIADCTTSPTTDPTVIPTTNLMVFPTPNPDSNQPPTTDFTVIATINSIASPTTNSIPPVTSDCVPPPTANNPILPSATDSAPGALITDSITVPPATDSIRPVTKDSLEPVPKDINISENSTSNGARSSS
ncbi:solute carrier family 22 member 23-like isoform X2 [Scleropages formosus]|uniref:solute carrier family 22 member 23-like isoform X2 n=1 Tax=Scleropages formosus TaxID=113540 RepID=UPI0010FA755D|nr:solute carrier family 22 member 23-like isoform X2 [Scleropages formosus]